jgi:hypothetical protein
MQKNETTQKYISIYSFCKYALITCSLVFTGCAQQTSSEQRAGLPDIEFYLKQEQKPKKAYLMKVAEDVLAEMHFTIEKADVDGGTIRTRPLPGAQFFEFWRSDNVGFENALAANLHTIRRTVTLDIRRQNRGIHIACQVQAQRMSLPERRPSSSARVYGMFSQSSPLLQRLILNPEQARQMTWIDLGRDPRLESEIIKRIEARIQRQTSQLFQTTEKQT